MVRRDKAPTGGRRFDLVVAALEAACGVVAAGYLVVVGIHGNSGGQAGRTGVDRLAPLVLAAVLLALLLGMALRSYRRAGRHGPSPTKPGSHPSATNPRSHPAPTNPRSDPTATPTLSDEGRRELSRIVVLLGEAGLFAPEVPNPEDLEAAVADAGAMTVDIVLMALLEADYWRPGFRADQHLAALAFHDSQVEQDRATLQTQVDDLARLVGDRMAIRLDQIEVRRVGTSERTEIDLTLDGRQHRLDYASHPKRLSTVLHVAVARALWTRRSAQGPEQTADQPRLAWLWTDQGVWLAVLEHQAVLAQLNTLVGSGADVWTWVDQEDPVAAGNPLPEE